MTENLLADMRVAFIGAGNMAEALVNGLVKSGVCAPERITVADVQQERIDFFRTTFSVGGATDNLAAVASANIVVLSVKPQVMPEVLEGLKGHLPSDALVISIAAGLRAESLETALGAGTRVVRVMPNTPALVGAGAAAIAKGKDATDEDMQMAETLMRSVGLAVRVDEKDMDAVTALSGSGPAYVFYLIEAMLGAGKQMGLEDSVARQLAYQTVEGAAKLIRESDADARELRARVTSKGGTTAAAVNVLDEAGVFGGIVDALLAAQERSKELSGA